MSLGMFTGEDALACIESEGFVVKWEALYASCPWATGYQHHDFVMPWYQIYRQRFLPVILVEFGNNGSLKGLLTLALNSDGTRLTGAGGHQAEYQGWIASADAANDFISKAIDRLRLEFAHADIALKYLPPNIPIDWIHNKPNMKKCCLLSSHARPVMKIDEAAMTRQRAKKNHRQNYNRLKRMGSIGFERIVEHQRFILAFDEISRQYDFRQAALYRDMPFSSDPLKKPFYLELHRRGILHTTVLTVANEIVASHTGLLSEGRAVHLGINTYAPAFAAHSPGNLLIAMLGIHLVQEQVPMLDLTPGGDGYKEHFASQHDQTFELTIFAGVFKRLEAQTLSGVKRLSKAGLQATGYCRADVLEAVEKIKSLGRLEFAAVDKLRPRSAPRPWVRQVPMPPAQEDTTGLPIFRNSLIDVFKYDGGRSAAQRNQFLSMVMKRLERSCQLYSYAPEDQLLIACWTKYGEPEAEAEPAVDNSTPTTGAVILFDLYIHRQLNDDELLQRFIERVLFDISRTTSSQRIYYRGDVVSNLQTALQRNGFREEGKGEGVSRKTWELERRN